MFNEEELVRGGLRQESGGWMPNGAGKRGIVHGPAFLG